MPELTVGGVPFEEASRFLRDKVRLPTKKWTDIKEGQHARGFVVAGATKDALLADFQAAIQSAIDNGTGLPQFRKDFRDIVARHGWTGWTGEGSRKGVAWRTRVVFETNLSMARAAGRWEQIMQSRKRRSWLRYVAVLDTHVRPDHRRWHGTVLPVDDEWWDTHYPPNGWNCRCTVMSLSNAQLADFGYEPSAAPPREDLVRRKDPFGEGHIAIDRGIDPGFNHNVGKAHVGLARDIPEGYAGTQDQWEPLEGGAYGIFTPADYAASDGRGGEARLEPRPMPAPLGPRAAGLAETVEMIEAAIGGPRATLTTPDGMAAAIDAQVLGSHLPASRSPFIPWLRDVVERPQEVWLMFERNRTTGQVVLRRRHLALYEMPGDEQPVLLVFQAQRSTFEAWTFIPADRPVYLERQRRGLRLWPPGKPNR